MTYHRATTAARKVTQNVGRSLGGQDHHVVPRQLIVHLAVMRVYVRADELELFSVGLTGGSAAWRLRQVRWSRLCTPGMGVSSWGAR